MAEKMNECESCTFYVYDENEDDYFCMALPDEDDLARMATEQSISGKRRESCPFYRLNDEYKTAHMQ